MSLLGLSLRRTFFNNPHRASVRGLYTLGRSSPVSSILAQTPTSSITIQPIPNHGIRLPTISHLFSPQTRTKMTKTRKRKRAKILERQQRVARGLPAKPLPPKYIPKDTPVINAVTREERDLESAQFDTLASNEMKVKIETQAESEGTLRFSFNDIPMSNRVRQLLSLTNGSQKEVVASQKRRGMELFQLREGDTGSSSVQAVALTTRIQQMQTHLVKHKKDYSGKRGLDALYVRRRKVLDYLERKDFESYRRVVKSLGLVR